MNARREALLLAVLLLLATGLRVRYFTGLQVGDDVVYSRIAVDHLHGDWNVWSVHAARRGFVLPIVASFAVLGHGEFSLVLYNILCSLGTVVVAYLLARRFFGPVAAFMAALAISVHPLLVFHASECHTDTALAFWTSLAMMLFLRADASPRPMILLVTAGLVLGWAYWTKEAVVAVIPFFVAHWIVRRRRWTWYVPMLLSGVLAVAVEWIHYEVTIGVPFYRYRLIRELHTDSFMSLAYGKWGSILFRILPELPGRLFLPIPTKPETWHRILNLASGIAAVVLWRRKTAGARFFVAWFLAIYLFYSFWPSSFLPYRPGFNLYAWTLPVFVVPLACCLGGFFRAWNRRMALAAVGIGLFSVTTIHLTWPSARRFAAGPIEARAWLLRENPPRIVSDAKTLEAFDFFDAHRPQRRYESFVTVGPDEKGVRIVDKVRIEPGRWWSVAVPPEVRQPPPSWKKMYESDRIVIYRSD